MSAGEGASLVTKAKEAGAASLPEAMGVTTGPLLEKLLSSMSDKGSVGKEAGRAQKAVHLIKNVQPLPKKVVEAIQDGNFVDFAWFPVLEEGPTEGDWKEGPGELDGRSSSSSERKRRERKEVPDLSMWSTCFSLFQVAWASHKPDMWLPLTAYRETIFRLARRHPWAQVVKYDRRFRQEAAGRDDVKWEKEKVPLVMELMSVSTHGKGETRSGGGSSGVVPKKGDHRRRGACFRFNKTDSTCMFGNQCKFAHVCSACGGEHPFFQCYKKGDVRTLQSTGRPV